jgi:hypothetical protein
MEKALQPANPQAYPLILACAGRLLLNHQTHVRATLLSAMEAGLQVTVTVLARVQQFLPQIEQSNAELLQRDPRSIDIEHIEETDGRVIEMASAQQKTINHRLAR